MTAGLPKRPVLTARDYKNVVQLTLATGLRLAGWLIANALISLGVPLALLLMIGGCSIEGAMHHLLNLAGRYLVADPGRRCQFDALLAWVVFGSFTGATVLRRQSLKHLVNQEFGFDRRSANV